MTLPRDQLNVSATGVLSVEEVATFDTTEIVNGILTVTTRVAPDVDRTFVTADGRLTVVEGVGYAPDFYANSAAAPGGDGLTEATAFSTIAEMETAALAFGNGVKLSMAYGSAWREELGLSSLTGVQHRPYGDSTLPLPKLDCADVADNADFSLAATYTNTYQITWTHSIAATISKAKLRVWEDGVRLKWVSSVVLCEAEAGTFHVSSASISNPATIYVHPFGNTNPVSDGKLYEITVRDYGLTVGADYDIRNIHTTRNAHNDGSFYATGAGYGRGILSTDGVVHDQWVAVGGTHELCVAYDCEPSTWRSLNATLFITYLAGGGAGATYKRCYAYSPHTSVTHDGYYAHTSGGANVLDNMRYEDCHYYGPSAAITVGDTTNFYATRSFLQFPTGRSGNVHQLGGAVNNYIDDATVLGAGRLCQFGTNIEITDMRAYSGESISGGMFWTTNVAIRNSTFCSAASGALFNTTGAAVEFFDNVVSPLTTRTIRAAAADSVLSDRNVFWTTGAAGTFYQIASTDYIFADWKTQTGEDAGSVQLVSQAASLVTAAASNDFTFTDGVVDTDGRTAGSRKHIATPDWATLVAAWQAGYLGVDGHLPPP
jgi:hypothetical protein